MTINNHNLNIIIRSFTKVNGLVIPLKVDIADIYTTKTKNNRIYNISISDKSRQKDAEKMEYTIDKTKSPFQKEYEQLRIKSSIRDIYKFVDNEIATESGKTFFELLDIKGEEDFVSFFMQSGICSAYSFGKVKDHIGFLKEKAKKLFRQEVVRLFELDKDLPKIKLDSDKYSPDKRYTKHLNYSEPMVSLQSVSEYPMETWFEENQDKPYFEWSWREQEIKRLYITAKNRIDTYGERVSNLASQKMRNDK